MRKIYAFIIAIILSIISILLIDFMSKKIIEKQTDKSVYYNYDSRNSVDYIMDRIITKNSMVVLGSSELSSSDQLAYPPYLYNYGYSNYNMILIGRGNTQSLHHVISLGSLENNIKNNKVVFIISPQWFTNYHISSTLFSSVFLESNYIEFLKNDKISKDTKIKVAERLDNLLVEDQKQLKRVNDYESIYLYKDNFNIFSWIYLKGYEYFINVKHRFEYAKEISKANNFINYEHYVEAEKIDYFDMLDEAEKMGNNESTNNSFGVYDSYFNTYIQEKMATYKDSEINNSYLDSPEYGDLRLFLDVCQETGITPLIISVPVNGRWYDYTGFPNEDREEYYQNIRDICKEYNVELKDFSDKEYEKYFLKDIMHLGWKGWVYLDEAVYDFYKN